jgi:hypothetical protein
VCFTFDLADVGVQTPKVFTDRVANAEARFRCSKSSKNRDKKAGISMRDEKHPIRFIVLCLRVLAASNLFAKKGLKQERKS